MTCRGMNGGGQVGRGGEIGGLLSSLGSRDVMLLHCSEEKGMCQGRATGRDGASTNGMSMKRNQHLGAHCLCENRNELLKLDRGRR